MARGCDNYTRSQVIRSAAAEAGRGLPMIESGMPLPAGTGLTRRRFISRTAGMALAVYGASKIPLGAMQNGIAEAAGGPPKRVLVSIFMDGGADALSILAPVGDSKYASLRPTLAMGVGDGTAFSEDARLRWHPAASGLSTLHSEGKVSVLPAIGYSTPNQSHFTSRHFWEIGELEVGARTGWLGRYIDLVGEPDNPLQGLSLDGGLSPSIATLDNPVAAVDRVTDFDLWARVDDPVRAEMFRSFTRFGSMKSDSPALGQTRTAISRTSKLRDDLGQFGEFTSPVAYPDGRLAEQLSGVAALLGAGMPLHCVTVSADGGFDTHDDQALELAGNLKSTSDAILAFQRDLEARGLQDQVLVEMWSEFGRRPEENGSGGTDHGAAGTAFVIGSKAAGQMVGEFPGLGVLDADDNLRNTSDFRAMYCSLLEQWLGQDAAAIIPGAGGFARPALVRP